jgi:ketosteroid isomerase-like protein
MDQIRNFFSLYKQFAWEKDSEGMINLYDDHVVVFDMWNKMYCSNAEWSDIIKQWLGSLKDERVNVMFEMITIQSGENTSFASALIRYQAISVDNKILRSMTNRITLGFTKTENIWKVIHQHTSAPIDSDLKAILAE